MLALIKRRLSLKVSITLALISIPPMIAAAYLITAHESASIEERTINSGKVAAMSGAKMYGTILEDGIDNGTITLGDLFDPHYEEIDGFDFGDKRYHTKYDFYTDRAVLGFQDKILESSPDFLYAVGGDLHGYTPTHNTRFQKPLTGDRAKDLLGNRTKRIFWTEVHQRAAANTDAPVLVQSYVRDTGEEAWDVSAPIFVKGGHFGAFRVAVSIDSIDAHQRSLLIELSLVFGFLALVTIGFIFVMLRRAMKPLEHLAMVANAISTGEGLDKPIKPVTTDEIGQMAKSLNRLRASLQAAMGRLGE